MKYAKILMMMLVLALGSSVLAADTGASQIIIRIANASGLNTTGLTAAQVLTKLRTLNLISQQTKDALATELDGGSATLSKCALARYIADVTDGTLNSNRTCDQAYSYLAGKGITLPGTTFTPAQVNTLLTNPQVAAGVNNSYCNAITPGNRNSSCN